MTSPHSHDRETLSALFDDELDGEARRFALRRLSHDTAWQDDCGRWQLIGDAMRRQAPIAAPTDLADRVRRELFAAPSELALAPAVATVATPVRRPYRLWAGGALAASVALAAVIGLQSPTVAPVAQPAMPTVAAAAPASVAAPAASAAEVESAPAVASVAPPSIDETPVRVARVDRAAPRTRAVRSVADDAAAPAIAAATPTVALPVDANPFHVPASNPLSSRPWPRSGVGSAGAFTASYGALGDSRGDTPSFYPFEPRPRDDASTGAETP